MAGYLALKRCTFDRVYLPQELIPEGIISESIARRLIRQKVIIALPNIREEGVVVHIKATNEDICLSYVDAAILFEILQSPANEVSGMLKDIENNDLLFCIHQLDSRKAVTTAIEKRAAELNPEQPEGE